MTAHAGETGPAESIWGALNLHAERIGHGLSAAQDPDLIEELVPALAHGGFHADFDLGVADDGAARRFRRLQQQLALQWFRPPIAAGQADGCCVKASRSAMFRVGYSTQVQHTPTRGAFGRMSTVTSPCGCYNLLS